MVLAVPVDGAVVQGLHGAVVSTASSEVLVVEEEAIDGVELLLGNANGVLHDEVLNALSARRGAETALIGVVLALERLAELPQADPVGDGDAFTGALGSEVPVDRVEEALRETTLGLDVEGDNNESEVLETSSSALLVDNVQLQGVGAVLGGGGERVLSGGMEVELADVVFPAIARVAAAQGDEAQVALDLEGSAVVGQAQVPGRGVVEVDAVGTSRVLTMTHTDSGVLVDVDRGLLLAGRAQGAPGRGVVVREAGSSTSGLEGFLLGSGSNRNQESEDEHLHLMRGERVRAGARVSARLENK